MVLSIAVLVLATGMALPGRGAAAATRSDPPTVSLSFALRPDPLLLASPAVARGCFTRSCAALRLMHEQPRVPLPWITAEEIAHAVARRFDDNPVAIAAVWLATSRIRVDLRPDRVYFAIRIGGT
jgi:hypothetical protein